MDFDAYAGLHRDVDVTAFHQRPRVRYVFILGHLLLVPFIGNKVFGDGDRVYAGDVADVVSHARARQCIARPGPTNRNWQMVEASID